MASVLQGHRFTDVGRRFDEGYDRVNALRSNQARMSAGNALSGGDYAGAAQQLYGAGELEAGSRVQGMGESRQAAAQKAQKDREGEVLTFTSEMAGRLSTILDENKDDPSAAVGAFDTFFAPRLQQLGETPDEIAQVRQQLAADARNTVLALGAGAAKQLGYEVQGSDDEVLVIDKATGQLVNRYRGARTTNVAEGGALYEIPGSGGLEAPQAASEPQGAPMAPQGAQGAPDPLFEGLVQQESGGRAGVLGPETPYGRAEGRTQMLPATAESMARKLGIPWRPDLMRGDTPAAADYQNRLGRAYLDEGLKKYRGDPRKALMYYHGGPDESLWGPKTNAYADAILAKVGPQLSGAEGQEQLAGGGESGGPRLLVSRPKAPKPQARRMSTEEVRAAGYQPGSVVMVDPVTGEETVKQGPGAGSGKITDGMRNIASYANDMLAANEQMNGLAQSGVMRPTAQVVVSERNGVTRLVARNPQDAQFVQAANAWLLPLLRKETGAAVTAPELAVYMDTYIPLPSDNDDVVRQKAASRRRKMLSLLQQSRPAFEDQFGQSPKEVVTYAPTTKKGGSGGPAPPKVGEIRKGYRFKGGNPGSPQSWEKAQ